MCSLATKFVNASWSPLIVIWFPLPAVEIPAPSPAISNVSLSKSIDKAPPLSPWKSKSWAVTWASTYVFTAAEVGTRAAPLVKDDSKAVIVIAPSDKLPNVIVPVVVIADEPLSILPKPLVILPTFKAPTEVICVCAASTLKLWVVPSPLVAAVDVSPVLAVIVAT